MRPESVFSETKRVTWFFVLMAIATVLATLLGGRWLGVQTERDLHIEFLNHVELTAQSLPAHEMMALEGTAADTNKAIYARLKSQLEIVQRSLADCRFVYILGQNKEGRLFFFVDGESAGSHDAVLPGQSYDEAPPALKETFEYWTPRVVGPYEDRWGTWVSAVVPLPVTRSDGASFSSLWIRTAACGKKRFIIMRICRRLVLVCLLWLSSSLGRSCCTSGKKPAMPIPAGCCTSRS